ncbi:helix-turn-helix domain-containing protein [Saccharopolyspora spinosa]|uniref:Transcriptional regulator with XRE-family HTH domain n=1 Tax=Saccharopolyspora spinosa TaxID=60894 RepID=A0A2N3Y5D8_SACSN|nr:helix-turn-helix transcriptional regulator [Saccharopolyspora spinosa]PKW18093.1 transcriptional regulator with XRE-family HTH domain [Saccharopolyspora spinosa]
MLDTRSVGDRIAIERKLAGSNQTQLAQEANYSVSMVRAVEQGREPASPGFIAAVARALGVEPEQLTGTPYRATIEEDGPLEGMAELRAILAEGSYVRPVQPGTLDEMAAEMGAVNLVYRNDKGRQALRRLPVLIRQLHGAAHAANADAERARVYSLLSSAYVTAERLCRRFGFMSLTTPAVDRLEWCVERADDPLYVAQAKIKRCRVLMYLGSTDVGLSLVERGLDAIGGDDEPALAVRGYGHLCGAIAAARGRKPDVARTHIEEARKLAAQMDGESDAYGTLFGPANVGIHSCAVELEAGDPGKAAREGAALKLPTSIAPPRAGHHWQDTARAWLLSGQPGKALDALNAARKVAPQQTRLHPSVRETLRGIAGAERRQTESLTNFVGWVGVKL